MTLLFIYLLFLPFFCSFLLNDEIFILIKIAVNGASNKKCMQSTTELGVGSGGHRA